ncbi:MAG TPA: zinc-binding dehydrogenase, partial [Micromonosporaceae bacterium]
RELALTLGVDRALDADEADHVPPDITFDASGKPAVAALAVKSVRRGGRAVLLSAVDAEVPVDMMNLLMGEKEIIASLSHSYKDDFPTAVRLLESGAVTVKPLITDRIPLADVVTRGFEALAADPSKHLKVLVFP